MSTTADSLERLISKTIETHPHLKSRGVRFETEAGHVVLRGTVHSYYHKQMAQEAVRRLEGVQGVENQLEVNWL